MAAQVRRMPAKPKERSEPMRRLLSVRGLRCTTPRLAVLGVFSEPQSDTTHLTAAQIHRRLTVQNYEIDLATIYRTVAVLVDRGVMHSLTGDHRVTTYGLAEQPHHHAVCTHCAKVIEVPVEQLDTASTQASLGEVFTLSEHAGVTLHGLCTNCRGTKTP